jgi:hypothetical protein
MSYKIEVLYETGDSFGYSSASCTLPFEWEEKSAAKETLKRIKEHADWYHSKKTSYLDELPQPEWLRPIYKSSTRLSSYECFLWVILDDGSEESYYASCYTGFFESFISAEIIETGLKVDGRYKSF